MQQYSPNFLDIDYRFLLEGFWVQVVVQSCEFLRSFLATGLVAQKRSMSARISVSWQPFNGIRLGCAISPEKLC
jgi:hypothetical protein